MGRALKKMSFTAEEAATKIAELEAENMALKIANEDIKALVDGVKASYAAGKAHTHAKHEHAKEVFYMVKGTMHMLCEDNVQMQRTVERAQVKLTEASLIVDDLLADQAVLFLSQLSSSLAARIEEHAGGNPSDAHHLDWYETDPRPSVQTFFERHPNLAHAVKLLRDVRLKRLPIAHPPTVPPEEYVDACMMALKLNATKREHVAEAIQCLGELNALCGSREVGDMTCPMKPMQ
jgi:hypothetical protein